MMTERQSWTTSAAAPMLPKLRIAVFVVHL
jgi:hypothetical protein